MFETCISTKNINRVTNLEIWMEEFTVSVRGTCIHPGCFSKEYATSSPFFLTRKVVYLRLICYSAPTSIGRQQSNRSNNDFFTSQLYYHNILLRQLRTCSLFIGFIY